MLAPVEAAKVAEAALPKTEPRQKAVSLTGFLAVVSDNTKVLGLLFFGLGSAFLTSYYTHVHYFPVLRWEEAFAYLAAIFLLGGGVALVYSLLLFFPGVIWSEFLIFESQLELKLCHDQEPCYWSITEHLVAPFAVFMIAVHLAMLSGRVWVVGLVVIVSLAIMTVSSWRRFRGVLSGLGGVEKNRLLLKYVTTVDLALASSAASLLFIYSIVTLDLDHQPPEYWGLLALCTVLITATNLLVAVQWRKEPGRAVVTAVMATLVLLIATEILHPLSVRFLGSLGLGRTPGTLVVNEAGYWTLKSAGFAITAQPGRDGVVENVCILSRLGSEYLVQSKSGQATIPKDEVLSWSTSTLGGEKRCPPK